MCVDRGDIGYVADTFNQVIRKVSRQGAVTTLAGLGSIADSADRLGKAGLFLGPSSIIVDSAGSAKDIPFRAVSATTRR